MDGTVSNERLLAEAYAFRQLVKHLQRRTDVQVPRCCRPFSDDDRFAVAEHRPHESERVLSQLPVQVAPRWCCAVLLLCSVLRAPCSVRAAALSTARPAGAQAVAEPAIDNYDSACKAVYGMSIKVR